MHQYCGGRGGAQRRGQAPEKCCRRPGCGEQVARTFIRVHAATLIAALITADPLFEIAYVFGDNRPFIACIVVLNPARWTPLAASLRLDPSGPASPQENTPRKAAPER